MDKILPFLLDRLLSSSIRELLIIFTVFCVLFFAMRVASAYYDRITVWLFKRPAARMKRIKEHLTEAVVSTKQINGLLEQLVLRVNCDRVGIIQYHNGGTNFDGLSFTKASMTNEVVRPGVHQSMETMQNLPIARYAYWVSLIQENPTGKVIFRSIDDVKEEDRTAHFVMHREHIQAYALTSIETYEGIPLGFLLMTWITNEHPMSKEECNCIREAVLRLSSLMAYEPSKPPLFRRSSDLPPAYNLPCTKPNCACFTDQDIPCCGGEGEVMCDNCDKKDSEKT